MALAPEPYLSACLETLYRAVVEVRVLGATGRAHGLAAGDCARLDDLMDAVHNLPRLLTRWETVDEQRIRDFLAFYDEKWATLTSFRLLTVYEREVTRAHGAG
jgi:hypothetical protein